MGRRRLRALVCVLWFSWVAVARAAEDEVRAAELYRQGKAAFERRDFARAEQLFHRSYLLSMRPALLFDLSLAQEEQDHCHEAALSLRSYLNVVGDAGAHLDIELRIRRLDEKQVLLDAQHEREHRRHRRNVVIGVSVGAAALAGLALGLGLGLGLPRGPSLTETTLGTHAGTR